MHACMVLSFLSRYRQSRQEKLGKSCTQITAKSFVRAARAVSLKLASYAEITEMSACHSLRAFSVNQTCRTCHNLRTRWQMTAVNWEVCSLKSAKKIWTRSLCQSVLLQVRADLQVSLCCHHYKQKDKLLDRGMWQQWMYPVLGDLHLLITRFIYKLFAL